MCLSMSENRWGQSWGQKSVLIPDLFIDWCISSVAIEVYVGKTGAEVIGRCPFSQPHPSLLHGLQLPPAWRKAGTGAVSPSREQRGEEAQKNFQKHSRCLCSHQSWWSVSLVSNLFLSFPVPSYPSSPVLQVMREILALTGLQEKLTGFGERWV